MFVKIAGKAIVVLFVLMLVSQVLAHDLIELSYGPRLDVFGIDQRSAATQTWDGGGVTNNWSEAANWSNDELPTTAVFDATSTKNAIIDISLNVSGIQIMSGYTGSITMAAGVNVTFGDSTASIQSGGTFNAGSGTLLFGNPGTGGGLNLSGGTFNAGSGPISFRNSFNQTGGTFNGGSGDVSGTFQMTGGNFVAPSGNLTPLGESANFNAATFSHNNGTVVFVGGNMNIMVPGSIVFNNLTINKNEFGVANFLDENRTIRVVGTLSLIEGRLGGPSSSPFRAEGAVNISPTFGFPDSSAGGSATIRIRDGIGMRNISWPSAASPPHIQLDDQNATLTLSGAGTAVSGAIHVLNGAFEGGSTNLEFGHGASTGQGFLQSGGTFHMGTGNLTLATGAFQLSGGTFTMDSGNATLPCSISVTISGGTFNASSGTTTMCPDESINGTGATLAVQSTGTFDGRDGTLNINHGLSLSGSGTFRASSGITRLGGANSFTRSGGTFDPNGGTVIFDSAHTSPGITPAGTIFNNLRFDLSSGGNISGSGAIIANGTVTLANGSVSIETLEARGNVTVESTADGGSSQMTFSGTGSQTFTNNGGPNTTGTWTVNKPSGILTAATDLILGTSQQLKITTGTLYLGNGSDLTMGTLNIGSAGTLRNDTSTTITLAANAVNNGTLLLNGSGLTCPQPDTILLRSSIEGTRRNWSGTGTFRVIDVDVKDMGSHTPPPGPTPPPPTITVFNGTSSGNNDANWMFTGECPTERVGFLVQPSNTTAGQPINPPIQVAVLDSVGNTVPNATNPITLVIQSNPGGGVLSGTVTRNAVMGIATFDDISINRSADGYTLQAISGVLIPATSNTFNVNAGPPTRLGFVAQPTNTNANTPITPAVQVAVQDSLGNTVPSATDAITVDLHYNPTGAPLAGILTRNAINGVATFPDLSVSRVSNAYNLLATATGLGAAQSVFFDVLRPIFLVSNTNDSGQGSLRQAILNANGLLGTDTINFNIPGSPPFTIMPATPLPPISEEVVIDGATQPGFAGTPIVELRGIGGQGVGLHLLPKPGVTTGSTIRSLVINGWGTGIYAEHHPVPAVDAIEGCYIGTDTTGTIAIPNGTGLNLRSMANRIGGPTAAQRNIISGNSGTGITLGGRSSTVQGNYIGTKADGISPLGNGGPGILVFETGNRIGGTGAGEGNVIAHNGQAGVRVISPATFNSIRRNAVFSNGGLGIAISSSGTTPLPNDAGDIDSGANNGQNYPVLDLAINNGTGSAVRGSFNSNPNQTYSIDFYSSPECDPSGNGEGRTYLGSTSISTDSTGIAEINSLPSAVSLQVGHFLTATATNARDATSEFSQCRQITNVSVSISGRALGLQNVPLANALVQLGGSNTATTVTNSNGEYSFHNLPGGGNFTVTISRPNFSFEPPSRSYTNVVTNQVNQNFAGSQLRFTIAGMLNASIAQTTIPLAGVSMTLSGAAGRASTGNVFYYFSDLQPGTYIVTPSKDGFTFSPQSAKVTVTNVNQLNVNFTATPASPLPGRLIFGDMTKIGSINADGTAYVPSMKTALNKTRAVLTADGRRITFAGGRGIGQMPADGADPTDTSVFLTSNDSIRGGAWSPGDVRTALNRSLVRGIWTAPGPGGVPDFPREVPLGPVANSAGNARWLNADRLTFTAFPDGGDYEIFAVNVDGTNVVQLTNNLLPDLWPVPSPDGTKIAFFRNLSGPTHTLPGRLMVMNADGSGVIELNDRFRGTAAWSPDGTMIAFIEQTDTSSRLVAVRADGSGGRRIIYPGMVTPDLWWGPEYQFPTPMGSNVNVIAGGVSVIFSGVGVAGTTTFTPIPRNSGGTPPAGYSFAGQAYGIETTAAYIAPITVCFAVPMTVASTPTAFSALALTHLEGGVLIDRTISRDFATRRICAQTSSTGSFVLTAQRSVPSSVTGLPMPSISGIAIDSSGQPLSDVLVSLTGSEVRTTQTDPFGNFEFPNLTEGGNFNVQLRRNGYTFSESSHTFIDLAGENTVGFVGTRASFSISGRVTKPDGLPSGGVTLTLEGAQDAVTLTDPNGNYRFDDLPAGGEYHIAPVGGGFFSPRSSSVGPLSANATEVDFAHFISSPPYAGVGGRVISTDGYGISKVRVTITDQAGEARSAITNPFGYYYFTGIATGHVYTLSVRHKDYEFIDSPVEIFLIDELSDLNFTGSP